MSCKRCKNTIKTQVVKLSGVGYFDVAKALKILKEFPREKELIDNRHLRHLFDCAKIKSNVKHLNHVDVTIPGILAECDEGTFLLDGNHRAVHCYINGCKRFYVYRLTAFETGQVFRKNPPKGKLFKK